MIFIIINYIIKHYNIKTHNIIKYNLILSYYSLSKVLVIFQLKLKVCNTNNNLFKKKLCNKYIISNYKIIICKLVPLFKNNSVFIK